MAALLLVLFTENEREIFSALALLALGNPFLPLRIALERLILRDQFVNPGNFMSPGSSPRVTHENIALITALVGRMLPPIRDRYKAGAQPNAADRAIYLACCLYRLYDTYDTRLQTLIDGKTCAAPFYDAYLADYEHYLGFLPKAPDLPSAVRLFEILYQIRRAFHYIYTEVRGVSLPTALLRARIWDAIFGGPLDDYGLHQWDRRHRISTLIQGPSGTGKELVANAIARSGYVPFNVKTKKFADHDNYYAALNLLAFSAGLLESELFGHRKGAFTGASRDKKGLLATVPRFGSVLLDEAAEIEPRMQIQLLRLLQERTFRRVGDEGHEIELHARILTATHRNPAEWMALGRLREDFFRRICMLKIVTPSLRERFDDSPAEVRELVRVVAVDLFGPQTTDALVDQVEAWIHGHMPHHAWTGNMREMQQCVAEVKASGAYVPEKPDAAVALALQFHAASASLAEVDRRYAELALARLGSRAEAARILQIDVRTLDGLLGDSPVPRGKRRSPGAKNA